MSELFSPGMDTLVIYSFMYPRGPGDDRPCPSCTGILDPLDGVAEHVSQRINLAVVAKTTLANPRPRRRPRLATPAAPVIGLEHLQPRYFAEDPDSGQQQPMMNMFRRDGDTIRHFWGTELMFAGHEPGQDPRHNGTLDMIWNVLDLTPDGRGTDWHEQQLPVNRTRGCALIAAPDPTRTRRKPHAYTSRAGRRSPDSRAHRGLGQCDQLGRSSRDPRSPLPGPADVRLPGPHRERDRRLRPAVGLLLRRPQGPLSFVPSELNVTAGEDVAFASCLVHCEGTSAGDLDLRLTVGLRKIDSEWTVIHEHHSVPTQEERFLDPSSS
jgi:hypothetical protein